MSEEKVPALEIEETEVEPIELPEGAKLGRSEGQQDFGKNPKDVETPVDDGSHPLSGKDSGSAPRATERRSRKEEAKKIREQKAAFSKYVQQMRKPVRHGEMQQILQHIENNILGPKLKILEDLVDKLQLLPDFIGSCLSDKSPGFAIKPSLESFEVFFEEHKEKLEKEAAELKTQQEEAERQAAEAAKKIAEEEAEKIAEAAKASKEKDAETPETEETQKE